MKIIKVPAYYDKEDVENLLEKFKQDNPYEEVIILSEDVGIIELPLKDLYKLRDTIDKEISNREMMLPGERNEL